MTPVDFMAAFANHLPLRVSRNLFEIPAEMDEQLAIWNAALIKIGDILMPAGPEARRTGRAACLQGVSQGAPRVAPG